MKRVIESIKRIYEIDVVMLVIVHVPLSLTFDGLDNKP